MAAPPWLTIWADPRATIRKIVATNPRRGVHATAVLTGALGFLALSLFGRARMSLLFPPGVVLIGTIVAAPLAVALVYAETLICLLSGWARGGNGAMVQVRAAVAWSWTPLVWISLIAIATLRFARVFRVVFESGRIALIYTPAGRFLAAATGILFAWSFFIGAKCLAEVHGFSVWKGAQAKLITVAVMLTGTLAAICLIAVGYEVVHALRLVIRR
jgi:hypothetical protein